MWKSSAFCYPAIWSCRLLRLSLLRAVFLVKRLEEDRSGDPTEGKSLCSEKVASSDSSEKVQIRPCVSKSALDHVILGKREAGGEAHWQHATSVFL
jgi:hypothetical protein